MRIFLLLLLGFPLLEMGLLVWLGSKFGLWVLLWLIATTVLGVMMLRHYGVSALLPVWGMMRQGQISLYQLLWPIRFVIAGVLFLIPGVLTDIAAILLLLPFGGPALQTPSQPSYGESPFTPPPRSESTAGEHTTIDGEYQRVDDVPPPRLRD